MKEPAGSRPARFLANFFEPVEGALDPALKEFEAFFAVL